jgi:hypothetical protein
MGIGGQRANSGCEIALDVFPILALTFLRQSFAVAGPVPLPQQLQQVSPVPDRSYFLRILILD